MLSYVMFFMAVFYPGYETTHFYSIARIQYTITQALDPASYFCPKADHTSWRAKFLFLPRTPSVQSVWRSLSGLLESQVFLVLRLKTEISLSHVSAELHRIYRRCSNTISKSVVTKKLAVFTESKYSSLVEDISSSCTIEHPSQSARSQTLFTEKCTMLFRRAFLKATCQLRRNNTNVLICSASKWSL